MGGDGGDESEVEMKMVEDKWCGVEVVAAAAWTGGDNGVGDLEAAFEYLASRKVTLRVSMAWAKGVTTGTLVRYETSRGRLLGNHVEDVDVRKSG
ncbi:hypothetical protein Tco_0655554 [Tanacetum coccineum]|uniref:Uncharacterized protein n=1 Tax=Tanacetum coccineum TaxID=301880 RepID=A0ABQ4X6Y7_9ASTR